MIKTIGGACLALGLLASTTSAQEIVNWGSSDIWDINIDTTIGHGCFIEGEFDDGSLVRMGFDPAAGGGYVTVFNEAWGDIQDGAQYDIQFDIDGQTYDGVAHGLYLNNVPGADIPFDNPDFFWDIMKKYTLTLYTTGGSPLQISLEGTYVALQAAMQCQDEVDAQRQ